MLAGNGCVGSVCMLRRHATAPIYPGSAQLREVYKSCLCFTNLISIARKDYYVIMFKDFHRIVDILSVPFLLAVKGIRLQ